MRRLGKAALLFIAIGLAIYAGVYYAAERLMAQTGRSNPFFKIAAAQDSSVDWVILGASHAMPLDFADFNSYMQGETGLRILNLASPGTGPLYNRFVLEHFLRAHRTSRSRTSSTGATTRTAGRATSARAASRYSTTAAASGAPSRPATGLQPTEHSVCCDV